MIVIATEGSVSPSTNTYQRSSEENDVSVKSFPSTPNKWGEVKGINKVVAPSKDPRSVQKERSMENGSTSTSESTLGVDQTEALVETSISTEPLPEGSSSVADSEEVLQPSAAPLEEVPLPQSSSSLEAERDLHNVSSTADESIPVALTDPEAGKESPVRKVRKWKKNEIKHLIKVRSAFETEARNGRTKKSLWKSIALALADVGYERTPEQCCSMWSSLVKKHKNICEDIKTGLVPEKEWVYFQAMQEAESLQIELKIAENSPDSPEPAAI